MKAAVAKRNGEGWLRMNKLTLIVFTAGTTRQIPASTCAHKWVSAHVSTCASEEGQKKEREKPGGGCSVSDIKRRCLGKAEKAVIQTEA